MSLLKHNQIGYKPFQYPWAYEAWKQQQKSHWLPDEVPLAEDVRDWHTKLTDGERNLLTQIFRFFTQADVDVNECYMQRYSRVFQPTEVQMMLAAFSNMETVHIDAYSHLLDTVGMPDTEYSAFMNYTEMRNKWEYLQTFDVKNPQELAITLATFGAFTEGLQLFASFAMLLNFPRFNKMKGMGQIIAWSVRDETLHCENIIKLYHTVMEEERENINRDFVREHLRGICEYIVEMEDAFIDLAFQAGEIQGMTAHDIKQYIRYIANHRLRQLDLFPLYDVKEHPLPWLVEILNGVEHANFFEQRATEYSRAATQGSWSEVFAKWDLEKSEG